MADTTDLVTPLLALTVLLDRFRMLLAILFGIVGMVRPPLLLAVETGLVIDGIGLDLLAMILSASPKLAFRLVADALLRAKWGGSKHLGAIGTHGGHRDPSGLK
jgi:hypothetical protein